MYTEMYALFVSFFPQLVAEPIERSKSLLKRLTVPEKWRFENSRDSLLLTIFRVERKWGYPKFYSWTSNVLRRSAGNSKSFDSIF